MTEPTRAIDILEYVEGRIRGGAVGVTRSSILRQFNTELRPKRGMEIIKLIDWCLHQNFMRLANTESPSDPLYSFSKDAVAKLQHSHYVSEQVKQALKLGYVDVDP